MKTFLSEQFSHYVREGNSGLTNKDFRIFLHHLQIRLTWESTSKIFKIIDMDNDGFLEWEDFSRIIFPEGKKKNHHSNRSRGGRALAPGSPVRRGRDSSLLASGSRSRSGSGAPTQSRASGAPQSGGGRQAFSFSFVDVKLDKSATACNDVRANDEEGENKGHEQGEATHNFDIAIGDDGSSDGSSDGYMYAGGGRPKKEEGESVGHVANKETTKTLRPVSLPRQASHLDTISEEVPKAPKNPDIDI